MRDGNGLNTLYDAQVFLKREKKIISLLQECILTYVCRKLWLD